MQIYYLRNSVRLFYNQFMKPASTIIKKSSLQLLSSRFFSSLSNASESFAPPPKDGAKNFNISSPVIKVRTAEDTDKLIKDNMLGSGKSPQNILPAKIPNPLAGELVTFLKPWKAERLDQNDSNKFDIILSCGLGGGSSEDNLYESFYPITKLLDSQNLAVYSSLTDCVKRDERFRKGLPYYYDESYINDEESSNFFKKVLEKRFFDNKGKLKDPENVSNLMLFGFSIGHRENKSHMNYLYQKISSTVEKEGINSKQIQAYFNKIALINIASPVNWDCRKLPKEIIVGLEQGKISPGEAEEYYEKHGSIDKEIPYPPITTRTINYRSVLDFGTAKPKSDFNNFHCNHDLFVGKIFKFKSPKQGQESMYLIGKGLMEDILEEDIKTWKNNTLGHNLTNYAKTIYGNVETLFPVNILKSSKDWERTDAIKDSMTKVAIFKKDREPSTKDFGKLKENWDISIVDSLARKYYNDTIRSQANQKER